MKTIGGDTNAFPTTIGLEWGYLFVLVRGELTKYVKEEVLWYIPFIDDIIFIDENRKWRCSQLEAWREAAESKGFKTRRCKTEYIECRLVTGEKKITEQLISTTNKYPNKIISFTLG